MFNKYYQGELEYLRELGGEFARAHPSTAGLLAARSDDPDVERLLEGVAFLTAQLKQRLDDAQPRLAQGLCQLLLPQYLRSIPAASIVEFTPQRSPKERLQLPRGTVLGSRPVQGTRCTFATTVETELLSVQVTSVALDESAGDAVRLTVAFALSQSSADLLVKSGALRLFLHGPIGLSALLLSWFVHHCTRVVVRATRRKITRELSPARVRAPAFGDELALLPWPAFAASGHRVVQEYFALPEKFMFVDITGLGEARGAIAERFELEFEFRDAPPLPTRIGRDNIRTNCVPVINLFTTSAEPLRRDQLQRDHLLRAARLDPRHHEIYSVDEVTGVQAGTARRRAYAPFLRFARPGEDVAGSFDVRRVRSPVDDGVDTYISLSEPRDESVNMAKETISIALTCTNRDLPAELGVSDISHPTSRSKTLASFQNITAVSKPSRPPLDGALHWRMLGMLGAQRRSLADPGVLASLLEVYNFDEDADYQRARANRRRVESIRSVRARAITLRLQQSPLRGVETRVELDETGFDGVGDAYLMGAILSELMASAVPINSFHQLVVTMHPSRREYRWRPRNGELALL